MTTSNGSIKQQPGLLEREVHIGELVLNELKLANRTPKLFALDRIFVFCLSFRDVEELLLERGVVVTYEAVGQWRRKFGRQYANQLRCRRPRPGDK